MAAMKSKPVPGVETGDHVYVQHPKQGAMAVKVLSKGADGFTGQCDKGERHGCAWDSYVGHKSRMLHQYAVVDRGADGALLEDDSGKRRYLAGDVPDSSPENFDTPVPDEASQTQDDPLTGGLGKLGKALAAGTVLFMKAGSVKNRPGLALKRVTDKAGHQTQRWSKTGKDAPAERKGAAPEAVKPSPMEPEQAKRSPGDAPMKHGDVVAFRHGDVQGQGKIVGSGADGVTVHDGNREHQVRHEHVMGPVPDQAGVGGAGKAEGGGPGQGGAGQGGAGGEGGGQIPPEHFDAHAYAAKFTDAHVSADGILDAFPPDVRTKMADVDKRLKAAEPSNVTYKKDGQYTPERAKLHQAIIDEFLSDARLDAALPPDGEAPTFTVLGGRGGSGKSWFTNKVFDPGKAIVLDADAIKKKLVPPYEGWNAGQVHEESSDLFDRMTDIARDAGLNIVHDATMKTADKAVALVKSFQDKGYRAEAHYMYLPPQEAARRAVHRFLGPEERYVPPGIVLGNKTNEYSFDQVKNLVDAWSFRDNNVSKGQEPKLISEKIDGADGREPGRHGLPAADRAGHGDQAVGGAGASVPEGGGAAQGEKGRGAGPSGADRGGVKPLRKSFDVAALFFKAAIPGGAAGDLLGTPGRVEGYVRQGKMVAGYSSPRAHAAPPSDHLGPDPYAPGFERHRKLQVQFPDRAHAALFTAGRDLAGGAELSADKRNALWNHFSGFVEHDPDVGMPFSSPKHVADLARDYFQGVDDEASSRGGWSGRHVESHVVNPDMLGQYLQRGLDGRQGQMAKAFPAAGGKRPLYINRPVTNGAAIAKHYQDQGCSPVVDPSDMHCTLCYSKEPVDWNDMGAAPASVTIPGSQDRRTAPLGDKGAHVLHFEAPALQARHKELRGSGVSHDFPSFQTHVTVSYDGKGFEGAKPWTGPIELGPERFAEPKSDWKPKMSGASAMAKALFFKAMIPGGAMADLLGQPVNVAGYVREGHWVPSHQALRHKRGAPPPAAMQHLAMTPGTQPHIARPVEPAPASPPARPYVEGSAPVLPPLSLSDTQKRKLAGLQNYGTRYEVLATHANGTKHRLGYTGRKSTNGLVEMAHKYGPRMSSVFGLAADAQMKAAKKHELHVDGGHKVHFSGRTQRDAILEGEHPHITEAPSSADVAAAGAAKLAAATPQSLPLPRAPAPVPAAGPPSEAPSIPPHIKAKVKGAVVMLHDVRKRLDEHAAMDERLGGGGRYESELHAARRNEVVSATATLADLRKRAANMDLSAPLEAEIEAAGGVPSLDLSDRGRRYADGLGGLDPEHATALRAIADEHDTLRTGMGDDVRRLADYPSQGVMQDQAGTVARARAALEERRPAPANTPATADAKHFYVSAIDGSKRHLVAGPYASHEHAKGMVEHVRRHADYDPRAHFMAWGTSGSDKPLKTPLGPDWKPAA